MKDLPTLVAQARDGDRTAYEEIVRRFQDMAVGYGYSILGDVQLAEDAAQEAFVNAYRDLAALRDPAAFPGWFRRIVHKHVDRIVRDRRWSDVPLDQAETASHEPDPAEAAERQEVRDAVAGAVQALPEHQRVTVALYYIDGYSQQEVGAFLEIPAGTVKSRLHAARKRLKETMIEMVQDELASWRPSRDEAFTRQVANLFAATVEGDASLVERLLAEEPALASARGRLNNPLWNEEAPALQVAVMHGRKDIVDLMLAHGADVNERDPATGFTPLLQALDLAFMSDYAELGMVDFLLERGARPDVTALMWQGDAGGLEALLDDEPALANAPAIHNVPPLCNARTPEMFRILVEHGADPFAIASVEEGDTVMRWVARWSHRRGPRQLRLFLEQTGTEIDVFAACVLGEIERVPALLDGDLSLVHAAAGEDHALTPGLTPLHLAARGGHVEIARLLLERGADVDAHTTNGRDETPLHLAVRFGRRGAARSTVAEVMEKQVYRLLPDMPRLLLEHGANVSARDGEGLTPLEWAEAEATDHTDRSEVAALLREHKGGSHE